MSTPNDPHNPHGGEPPQDPHGGEPPQDPYGSQPPQPYGTQPPAQPTYGAPQPGPPQPQYGVPQAPEYGASQYPSASPYPSAPQYAGGYGASQTAKNSLGVWSLVLGILSIVLCGIIAGIAAIIVGNNAKKAVARGEANNGGMATAGVVLGWISVALTVIGLVVFAIIQANHSS
jgi:F0F1-type ATP synthase membrane subunit c/vacuolar-type H+-ATPase subunit K